MAPQPAPDAAVIRLSRLADRADFLPRGQHRYALEDRPLPIGHGSTNSQPSTVAAMLDLLEVAPGQRILDVGAGSGWTTCLLAALTGPAGRVLGLEIDACVAAFGAANVDRWTARHVADAAPVTYARAVPGLLGAPDGAPYDRILVSAMAARVPPELVRQLAPGGIMVVPAGGRMAKVRRRPGPDGADDDKVDPEHTVELVGWYRFVPLR